MNGGEGHYREVITESCGVRVVSDTFLPQETLCFVENSKGKKKEACRTSIWIQVMADLSPAEYITP